MNASTEKVERAIRERESLYEEAHDLMRGGISRQMQAIEEKIKSNERKLNNKKVLLCFMFYFY